MDPTEQEDLVAQRSARFRRNLRAPSGLPHDVLCIVNHIHEHFLEEDLEITSMLDEYGIRDRGFASRFKHAMHRCGQPRRTPQQYLEHLRMQAAILLLEIPEVELALISDSVGYKQYQTFYKAFHRHFGTSPSQYRNALSGG